MQRHHIWLIAIVAAALTVMLLFSYSWIVGKVGGAFHPSVQTKAISPAAQALIDSAFDGIEAGRLKDYHVHVIGLNQELTGSWVDPGLLSWWGLHSKIKGDVFIHSSGVTNLTRFDEQYVDRLVSLVKAMPVRGKYQLLALDYYHTPDGERSIQRSELFVDNDYVQRLTAQHPESFTAAVSIHPYRKDAVRELEYWANRGVHFVKWLPNSQGIRADDPQIDEYYATLVKNRMVLLTHVGLELAVSSTHQDQTLGNPLRFARALDMGVKIIMAHAASAGQGVDYATGEPEDNFRLFMRLMRQPQYKSNLFGDISAVTQSNRLPGPLTQLLEQSDIHDRLVNGSDYPLPAINIVISTRLLAYHGFITEIERDLLNEIYRVNPLLFDFVTKRTLRHPLHGNRFPPRVFMENPRLEDGSG